jgi:hypothetical protein
MFINSFINFFKEIESRLTIKGYSLQIDSPTNDRKKNSVGLSILSNKKNITIIIWDSGECHLDYLNWEIDEVWNKGLFFNNEDEMLKKMIEISSEWL